MASSPSTGGNAADRLLDRPVKRLLAALADPARRERTVVMVLAAYCGLWTLYGAIAKGSQDIHFDMGEMIAWSRETDWGTPKHPPLGAWLVRAWFSVFPLADWAYYLFAMALATLALWIAWKVAARYLDAEKQVRRALDTLSLPWDNRVLNYRQRLLDTKRVTSPTFAAVAEPIYKRAIGRWKNYERLLEPAMKTLEPFIREFGYST